MKKGKASYFSNSGKLFVAAFGLFAFTLFSSVTATYAWYKVRDFARIDQLSMAFSEDATLEMGLRQEDGTIDYKQVLNADDFRKVDPHYDSNTNLKDVSSMFSSEWLAEQNEDTKPILHRSYATSKEHTKTEAATEGFLQYETYFRSKVPCHLYLTENTSARVLERFNHDLAEEYSYNEEELNRVLDSVRVSFYSKEGFHIAEPGQTEASHTRFGGPLQAHNDQGYFDYADGKEILYGEYEGEPTYLPALEEDSPEPENKSAFNAKHKAGVERVDVSSVSFAEEESRPLSDFLLGKAPTGKDAICLGTLNANEDFRLVITIYIEGWDLDLTDTLAKGKFSLDLNFAGLMDI